jgi:hypothetical protein
MPKLVVNLDAPDFLGLTALDRHLKISVRLRDAGFKFSTIDDLWPIEIELEKPYSLDVDGSKLTFEQQSAH